MTARWPQHHLLAWAVAALIVGGRWPLALPVVSALAWATQPRSGWAAAAVVVALLAGVGGAARTAHEAAQARAPLAGGAAVGPDERVEVLEAATQALDGRWRTTARLRDATVELRTPVARDPGALRTGRLVRVRGRLRPVSERALGARSRGIALTLDATVVGVAGRRGGWRGAFDRLRERAEGSLAFRHDGAGRTALLRGMVLGQDEGFTPEQEETYRRSGLSHLVAASGQNVAFVAALVIGLGAVAGVGRRPRLLLALAAVAAYVPLAGAGPSIRRAGVAGVLTLLALLLGRAADRWWALIVAAGATVLVDPWSPGQLGWQLSFAAVAGLLLLADPLAAAARRAGLPGWAGVALAVPLGAGLATAPVLAASVGDVSVTSLVANVVVEPVVAPVTWLGMVAAALGPEGAPLTGLMVTATTPLLDWIAGVAAWAATPGWAVLRPGALTAALPLAAVAAALLAVHRPAALVRASERLRRRLAGHPAGRAALRVVAVRGAGPALAAALAGGLLLGGLRPRLGAAGAAPLVRDGVVVLDVGQGSATLLRDGDAAVLVDAGPADGRVVDRLAAQGVTRLDALVLSHAAADHTGGAPAVVQRLRPRLLVDGRSGHPDPAAAVAADLVAARGGQVVAARSGLRIGAGRLVAELRWPPPRPGAPPAGEDPNDRAVVVRAQVAGLRVLVPSDREGAPLRQAAGGPVDVLVLPHHGSEDPDVPRLLQALRPRVAVAQVGRGNSYGHPAPPTVAAVRAAGVALRRTDRDGSVGLAALPDGAVAVRASGAGEPR